MKALRTQHFKRNEKGKKDDDKEGGGKISIKLFENWVLMFVCNHCTLSFPFSVFFLRFGKIILNIYLFIWIYVREMITL